VQICSFEFADKMLGFVKAMFTLWHGFKENKITLAEYH